MSKMGPFVLDMTMAESPSWLLAIMIIICVIWIVATTLYRLYISPLSRFPGPRLAALTSWYEFYHDCLKRGRFTWEIKRMHDQYGQLRSSLLTPVLPVSHHQHGADILLTVQGQSSG